MAVPVRPDWLFYLYPRHCPLCQCLLPHDRLICDICSAKLPMVQEPCCYQCGKPLHAEEDELCYDCSIFSKSFKKGLALFIYNEVTRPFMISYKYYNKRYYTDFFISQILKAHRTTLLSWHIQAIVPVPIHKNRRKSRGYNQAALLAEALGRSLGIPCISDLLVRSVDTTPQKGFHAQARLFNLKDAFTINPEYDGQLSPDLSRVLLIDDIYTTGATMEVCARALQEGGIRDIFVYSICIGIARAV